jgi:hypothetical protein
MNIYDFEIVRLDTKTIPLEFCTDSGKVDITNWTIFFTMKEKITDADNLAKISKTITVHVDPVNGYTEILLTTTDTTQNPGNYIYDIQVSYSGEIHTILTGTFTILSGVTNRVA